MVDKTPKRIDARRQSSNFSPIILPESPAVASPQRNLTGSPRVARDIAADLYNTIQKWNDLIIKGAPIVKEVASIKADSSGIYSEHLEDLMNELFDLVQRLRNCRDIVANLESQMRALAKLHHNGEPLFISLTVSEMADRILDISNAYKNEYQTKEFALENIAHSRNKDEAMFLAALWTYQVNLLSVNTKLEALLYETGHRRIT